MNSTNTLTYLKEESSPKLVGWLCSGPLGSVESVGLGVVVMSTNPFFGLVSDEETTLNLGRELRVRADT